MWEKKSEEMREYLGEGRDGEQQKAGGTGGRETEMK